MNNIWSTGLLDLFKRLIRNHEFPQKLQRTSFAVSGLLLWAVASCAQTSSARIEVLSLQPPRVQVALQFESPRSDWSFSDSYGSVRGLAGRVANLRALNLKNETVDVDQVAPGVYRSRNPANQLTYEVSIDEPPKYTDRSHVSWLNREQGLLMLADLLPDLDVEIMKPLRVSLKLPANWNAVSGSAEIAGTYSVPFPNKAVFLISTSLRTLPKKINGSEFRVALSGVWPFKDDEARKTAAEVLQEYVRVNRHAFPQDAVLMLIPTDSGSGTWTAETRGSSVVLLLSPRETKDQLLARLAIILTHEMLHLWVPNSLSLKGAYDWFFEGFTLYQALLSSIRLKLIDFNEYLRTLGRVYDSYRAAEDRNDWSLVDLSERRWTSSSAVLYDKGMLVALLYDLSLREATGNSSGLSSIYSKLPYSATTLDDGNEVIIGLLDRSGAMTDFPGTYIKERHSLELESLLPRFGINVERLAGQTRLVVSDRLTTSQRKVLKSLGYKK